MTTQVAQNNSNSNNLQIQSVKTESQLIDEVIADQRKFRQDYGRKKPVTQQLREIIAADTDKNGTIDRREFREYLASSATAEVRASMAQLDCSKPEESAIPKIAASITTDSMRRTLEMLKRKQPGFGTERQAREMFDKIAGVIEQMLDAQGSDQPGLSAIGVKKLADDTQKMLIEEDTKALTAYDGMVKRGELGKLPTQVLPITATDFCAVFKK
jgi:hypothetical protein